MKKGIVTVFIILGILVLGLIIWAFVFNGGGLQTAWNAVADPINNVYQGMTGGSNTLIAGIASASTMDLQGENQLSGAYAQAGW